MQVGDAGDGDGLVGEAGRQREQVAGGGLSAGNSLLAPDLVAGQLGGWRASRGRCDAATGPAPAAPLRFIELDDDVEATCRFSVSEVAESERRELCAAAVDAR